jgi:uncharacterized protein (TIGR02996 family)
MSDEATFLQAIREDPDADGPRLVYADWLDEQGDPRGEFIRAQCRLERLAPDDPEAAALRSHEFELLERHRAEWEAVLHNLRLKAWTYRRGLVEAVTLALPDFAAQASRLFALLPVVQVRLIGLGPESRALVESLAVDPCLAHVRRLDLSNTLPGRGVIEALLESRHLTGLTWLDLRGGLILAGVLQLLANARHLPRLTTVLLRRAEMPPPVNRPDHPLWQALRSRYHGLT